MKKSMITILLILLMFSLINFSLADQGTRSQEIEVVERAEIKEQIKERVENQLENMREEMESKEQKRKRVREEIEGLGGKRELEYMVGSENEKVRIKVEERLENEKIKRKITYRMKNGEEISVETELEIKGSSDGGNKLRIELENGEVKEIILPEEAYEIAKERIKSKNMKIEMEKREHKNIPRVVYHIQAEKQGKFLGIFKTDIDIEVEIDSETGEIIEYKKPWWAFLISGEDNPDEEVK